MRICSLLPSATEIAFALGLGDDVVAVTHECDYPPEARKRRVVVKSAIDSTGESAAIDRTVRERVQAGRGLYALDLDGFRAARPDFIITQDLCEVCALDLNEVARAADTLPHRPKIVSLAPTTLGDVLDDIARVGAAAGKESAAAALVADLRARIERVRELTSRSDTRPRVACVEWTDPIYPAGHWVPEMVEIAGGGDGLGNKGAPAKAVPWEDLRAYAPEVVVLMPCGFGLERAAAEAPALERLEGWRGLPAVKAGRVFAVDGSAYFNRPGPRLVDGVEILAALIHPEIFPAAPTGAARRLA
ncbi:MAG TPA: cobalamin-binding protein [Candidatus Binatia bacterium]|jgi:iron complex transport system substrate-binding protein